MEQKNMVLDVHVEVDDHTHTATYFVENDIVNVMIGDHTYRIPAGPNPSEDSVRSLLIEKMRKVEFRRNLAEKWSGVAKI